MDREILSLYIIISLQSPIYNFYTVKILINLFKHWDNQTQNLINYSNIKDSMVEPIFNVMYLISALFG